MRRLAALLIAPFALACGVGGATGEPNSPASPKPADSEPTAEVEHAIEAGPPADVLYPAPVVVPPSATECPIGGLLPAPAKCPDARDELAGALMLGDGGGDAALAEIEQCAEFPRGLVRALRAELGQPECGDALVEAVVGPDAPATNIPPDIRETLVSLGLGARLSRLAVDPPEAPETKDKGALEGYFANELFPWISKQAQAIFEMASQGTRLSGYARGVVAIEAGNADMRFVEIVREAPLADEIAEHQEAKDLYYATLDERLEPRKARGRNAALVGLREMARIGVRSSPRVSSARALLSRVYGGRRINALDALLIPEVPPEKADGAMAAIASRVPTAYAPSLVGIADPTPVLVRAHLQMGMPPGLRRDVAENGTTRARLLLARALFESGRTYFRAEDFQAAQALLTRLSDETPDAATLTPEMVDELRLLRALALALSAGPKDAAELIAKGPRFADSLGNLAILDGLAEEPGVQGGRAGFNAAYLRELVAPEGAPDYWADLSRRYLAAAKKLTGAEHKRANERGAACRAIEKELRK